MLEIKTADNYDSFIHLQTIEKTAWEMYRQNIMKITGWIVCSTLTLDVHPNFDV